MVIGMPRHVEQEPVAHAMVRVPRMFHANPLVATRCRFTTGQSVVLDIVDHLEGREPYRALDGEEGDPRPAELDEENGVEHPKQDRIAEHPVVEAQHADTAVVQPARLNAPSTP